MYVTRMPDRLYSDIWIECWNCGGELYVGHDCGDDTCCCMYPEDNVLCDICNGKGGWYGDADHD